MLISKNQPYVRRKVLLVCIEAAGQLVLDTVIEGVCSHEGNCYGPEFDEACKQVDKRACMA